MSWWQRKRTSTVQVRQAHASDRPALAALLARTWHRHGLAAVEEQIALLSTGASLIALADDEAVGFLGLAPRLHTAEPAERWVDVRLVAVADEYATAWMLGRLLAGVETLRFPSPVAGLVCLTSYEWHIEARATNGFGPADRVISYVRSARGPLPAAAPVAVLRAIQASQGEAVLALNRAAFAPLWRYDQHTVLSWLMTADHAVLAEGEGRPVGFALTTRNTVDGYAQLIRVATHPARQGQGIGRQLVVDAIRYAAEISAEGVSLNTQASNIVARHLYEALGFRPGEGALTVMVWQ